MKANMTMLASFLRVPVFVEILIPSITAKSFASATIEVQRQRSVGRGTGRRQIPRPIQSAMAGDSYVSVSWLEEKMEGI